jgi:asparagine synthase (glutamine-hydrolysing)
MCGIVGIFSLGQSVSVEKLKRATDALKHRGPEGQGVWISPDGKVGLGHTRLSINDLSGAQPIASENQKHHIVVNGEFYDFKSIRRNLESNGHHFRTQTDSEIGLHLYEEMQTACLDHLRGEFAFIVWDEEQGRLFAARDRFGAKPLFYTQVGDTLYLASEAKALFAAGVHAAWDHESVFQRIYTGSSLGHSLFQGIKQIPPGHFMIASREGVHIERYWDISYPRNKDSQFSDREYIEQVHQLLTESVRLRMEADVPVGYLLSGGIDSSTLLGLASAHSGKPLTAFTIGFNDGRYDESSKARMMAECAGADLKVLAVNESSLADNFSDSAWHGEAIQYNAHGTARFMLSKVIQDAGYKSVMGGEGADESFLGYSFTAIENGASGIIPNSMKLLLKMLKPMNQPQQLIARTSPLLARISALFGLPEPLLMDGAGGLEFIRSIMQDKFLAEFRGHDPYRKLLSGFDVRKKLLGREPAKILVYLWMRSIFVNYHMAADRLDMAHAVEVRLPFLDHKLFEFVSQIPVSVLSRDGKNKYILREVGRPYVTDDVYSGAKKPFFAPPSTLKPENKIYEITQDILRGSVMASIPFFDQTEVIRVLDNIQMLDDTQQALLDPILMMMLSMCFLHQRFDL